MTTFDKDVNTVCGVYGNIPERHTETDEWPVAAVVYRGSGDAVPLAWGLYCGANEQDHAWWRSGVGRKHYLRGLKAGARLREVGL
jgi:hypothetical protein